MKIVLWNIRGVVVMGKLVLIKKVLREVLLYVLGLVEIKYVRMDNRFG